MGYITTYTQKDGKEVFKVFYEIKGIDGKRKRKSKNFPFGTKKKDVQAFLREKELQYERGKLNQSIFDDMLLSEFVENHFWAFTNDLSPYTTSSYKYMYKGEKPTAIKNSFASCTVKVIDRQAVQGYVDFLIDTGYSPKTVKNYVHFLGHIFNIALKLGAVDSSPCEYIILPKNRKKNTHNFLEKDEALFVLKESEKYSVTCNAIYSLLILLGLRKGELLALTWDDVDFKNKTIDINKNLVYLEQEIVIKPSKTVSGIRKLYMPDYVVKVLRKLYVEHLEKQLRFGQERVSNNVITKENGDLFMPEHLWRFHRQFFKTLEKDVRYITIHGCRHTAASLMIAEGSDPKTVQQNLGHSSLEMTLNIYSHALDSSKKETAKSLDNLINGARNSA